MQTADENQPYEFEGFRLDPNRRLLFGPDGEVIPLRPKVLDTLIYLVQHAGAPVDKRVLMEAVWGRSVVEENSLNQHISTLRRVLGERPGQNRFIATVPSRGYRFVARVQLKPAPGDEAEALDRPSERADVGRGWPRSVRASLWASSRRILIGAVVLAMAAALVRYWPASAEAPPPGSIAVLPFADLSESGDREYFSDGVAEGILNLLAKIPGLRVTARTSAFSFKHKDATVARIAHTLHVAHLLEGSVQFAGDRLRVTALLVDARTGNEIWSQTYDRKTGDVFAIQDEIAATVVKQLRVTLLGPTPVNDETDNPEAYGLYLRAKYVIDQQLVEQLPNASQMLQTAIDLDPDFFPAWRELIGVYQDLGGYKFRSASETQQLVRQTIEAARARFGDSPELVVEALAAGLLPGDLQAKADAIENAVLAEPGNVELLQSAISFARYLNRPQTVIRIGEYLIERDPLCAACYTALMGGYLMTGQYDQVARVHRQGRALNLDTRGVYALSLVASGKPEAALAELDRLNEYFEPRAGSRPVQLLVRLLAYKALGRGEDQLRPIAGELLQLVGNSPEAAEVHGLMGDMDTAFEILMAQPTLSMQQFDGFAGAMYRQDPRWPKLAEKVGLWPEDPREKIRFEIDLPK